MDRGGRGGEGCHADRQAMASAADGREPGRRRAGADQRPGADGRRQPVLRARLPRPRPVEGRRDERPPAVLAWCFQLAVTHGAHQRLALENAARFAMRTSIPLGPPSLVGEGG